MLQSPLVFIHEMFFVIFLSYFCPIITELESYSNIVGAFRAQGTLNANKMKILKDLREALHISDARHKAEVRRVVNDESLSTIAKKYVFSLDMLYAVCLCESNMQLIFLACRIRSVCGPNSEIEWNKEGSRGHAILNRNTSHTALSVAANHASAYGAELNLKLVEPADTMRNSVLSVENDNSEVKALITEDPQMVSAFIASTTTSDCWPNVFLNLAAYVFNIGSLYHSLFL